MFKVVKTGKKTAKKGMPSLIFHRSRRSPECPQKFVYGQRDIALGHMFPPLMPFGGYRAAKQVSSHFN